MFDLKYIENLEFQKQMKRTKLMKKKALESKLKPHKQMGNSILNKLGKFIKDEDDVDYYDPVTHAICGETLAADYKKEKQIKLLEEFERKNTKLRD